MARRGQWRLTPNTTIWTACRRHREDILQGTLLSIDPSCGSSSSMPGYALYYEGELIDSGVIEIPNVERDLAYRLQDLGECLRTQFPTPDVLAIEEIPVRRFGGGSATSHASLLKSVGAVMASVRAPVVVTVRPQVWRALRHEGWVKGDEQYAIAIGHALLEVIRRQDNGD